MISFDFHRFLVSRSHPGVSGSFGKFRDGRGAARGPIFSIFPQKSLIRRPQGAQTESCCCRELTSRVVIGEYIPLQQYNDLGGQISPDDRGKNGARGTILPQWQTNFWRQNEARWRIFLKQNDGSGKARNLARFATFGDDANFRPDPTFTRASPG